MMDLIFCTMVSGFGIFRILIITINFFECPCEKSEEFLILLSTLGWHLVACNVIKM